MPPTADILLVTVTAPEREALRAAFQKATGKTAEPVTRDGRLYHRLGSLHDVTFFHALSQMGSESRGAMRETVDRAIKALQPGAVIAVGIAYGVDSGKQKIGDILMSRQVHCCEPAKVGRGRVVPRGDTVTASPQLLNFFQEFALAGWNGRSVKQGIILSSEKLIDHKPFRDALLKNFPEAIGGEMEGSGLYYACAEDNVQWIVIKAICDWADGNKDLSKSEYQELAATNAAQFLVHALQTVPLLIPLKVQPEIGKPKPDFEGASQAAPPLRSNIQELRHTFMGRDALLQRICQELGSAPGKNVLVLHGVPGVGKSELAREVARRRHSAYPGGTFEIDFNLGPAVPLAEIGRRNLGLGFASDLKPADQAQHALTALFAARALLIYDNVTDQEALPLWLPPHGTKCHILITSFLEKWDGWWAAEVEPLSPRDSLALVENLAGPEIAAKRGEPLAAAAGGLPVELCPAALAMAAEYRRWKHLPPLPSTPARESQQSFDRAYSLLDSDAQLLLQALAFLASQRAALEEIAMQFRQGLEWSVAKVRQCANACIDLHLLQGGDELRMHQTVAGFIVRTSPSPQQSEPLATLRKAQAKRLAEIAGQLQANPARTDLATVLLLFPVTPDRWEESGVAIPAADGETIGRALYEIGRFFEAQPWYERAVKEKERGDLHGSVDHESLGSSLHLVGRCLDRSGKYAEAQRWFERAVKEAERGDVHGRVDHQSLGSSLHLVGYCLSETGKYAEAQPWFERAVKEKERGDVHGRADHESLGSSLHQVGYCLSLIGKYAEAQPWYERAVKEAERGDVHGRVDHASLGTSLHQVGRCLDQTEKHAEAQPWLERAVKEAERGDVHGRVDHESLGSSLHLVGYCLSETGKYAEAERWFERAAKEAERGDVHGRVDHDQSLGRSLHQVGDCLSQAEKYAEAQPWFERAVKEKERGDIHGRVDHESLGLSLRKVGDCLSQMGNRAEAQTWFERAKKEAECGDIDPTRPSN